MTMLPPAGPPWDLPVDEAPLAFVDLEMTGLDVTRDRVVEICIERVVRGEVVGRLSTLVRPDCDRIGGNAHVHGLDAAALQDAPSFASLLPEIERLLEGAIFVAHAAEWDVKFLVAELKRAGKDHPIPFFVDTLTLARRAFKYNSYSLGALCTALGLERGQAHRANDDVRVLRRVFERCVEVLAPVSVRDLWEVRIGERRARTAIVDACEAAAKYGTPVVVTYRATRRAPEPLTVVISEVRSDVDPPRVLGYLLPGRGRRELRADRILKVEPADSLDGSAPSV
jgi:DNA polymerase-3 subunit epsilon